MLDTYEFEIRKVNFAESFVIDDIAAIFVINANKIGQH